MSRICEICGKGAQTANRVTRRGRAKKEGGAGRKITGRSKRRQKPNLQKVRAMVDGRKKRIRVCTACLRSNKVQRAL